LNAIPQDYATYVAIALGVAGLTAAAFGIATIIDTQRGRASCGDACMAFGLVCCAVAGRLMDWDDVVLPILLAVALVRMVLAVAAAIGRWRNPPDDRETTQRARHISAATRAVAAPDADAGDVTVRLETPIDEADLFARPDRPRAAMDAIVRQLGKGSRIVAVQARKG
jgi:uncharacterized membrane protein